MSKLVLLFLLAVSGGWRAFAQPDCSTLNVERTEASPISGSSLSVCQTSSGQCCSQQFLDKVKTELGEELLEDLKEELRDNMYNVANITDILASYLEDAFLTSLRSALPVPSIYSAHISDTTAVLANLLNRAKFVINDTNPEVNTTATIVSIFDGVRRLINNIGSSPATDPIKGCLLNLISRINDEKVRRLGEDLEEMRRAYTLLSRILNFLNTWTESNRAFLVSNIPKACIQRAIEIAFCSRCQRVLPPLCSNTCGALVRGCYAPYVTGLRDQFNRLWDVTRQAVQIVRTSASRIVEGTGSLINSSQIAGCLRSSPIGKRQAGANFPTRVESLIPSNVGLFVYGTLGPRFCLPPLGELRYCRDETAEPSNRRCSSDEICTSTCKCWNGGAMQDGNTAAFTGTSVDEQDKNPVLTVPKEESEALIATLGAPVTSFLTSDDVATILPQNITLSDNANTVAVISMVTLLGLLLLQFLIV